MAKTQRFYDPISIETRSWSPGFYDNTSRNTTNRTSIISEYISYDSPRDAWRELKLRENAFTLYREKVTRGVVSLDAKNESLKRYTKTSVLAPVAYTLPYNADIEQLLRNIAWLKLYRKVGEFKADLGQLIAERQRTVGLLNRGLKMIFDFNRAMRLRNLNEAMIAAGWRSPRGESPSGRRGAKIAADAYLALNLGLLPVAKDLYGLVNKELRPPTMRKRGSEQMSYSKTAQIPGEHGTYFRTFETKVRFTATAKVVVPSLDFFCANIAQQLGLSNPALLAWEVLPYSFVVDWFLGIGTFLRQFGVFHGLQIVELSETLTYESAIVGERYLFGTMPGFPSGGVTATMRSRTKGVLKDKKRNLPSKPPVIWPQTNIDIDALDVGKLVTLTALVAQSRLK
ncbi:MAG: maturation protein [Sanya fiers-like virus 2]|nr:MAG: maturation protein [Sanya fiers-like virus 2]UUW21166.1 MAG: maturation protein [Sanya fiers-like virus 2]